jgi:hypothetical protein
MAAKKYLMLQRSTPNTNFQPPSPAQMQELYASFHAWKEKYKANILDLGGKLTSKIHILSSEGLMDGPLVETKELIGGYMIVAAETFDEAVAVAKESPGVFFPGSSIEIREISFS